MSAVIKLILFIVWGAVFPAAMGLLPAGFIPACRRRIHHVVILGFLSSFALFEVIGVPVLFLTELGDFALLVRLYVIFGTIEIAAGVFRTAKTGGIHVPKIRRSAQSDRTACIFWCIFLGLLAFELYMAYTRAFFDGDDAYYVAQSVQTWQTGTMYHYVPYTGVTTTLDGRHAMAMLPMWIAAVAKLCGTHPTIVTHSMIPMVFIPLVDTGFYLVARVLLYDKEKEEKKRQMLPAFMIVLALLQIFGGVSIYTPEIFLIMRTWQGKTLFANFIVPACFGVLLLLCLRTQKGESARVVWVLAVLINTASGICTSLAPFFTAFVLLLGGFWIAVVFKKKNLFFGMIPACIPNMVYAGLLYLVLKGRIG